MKVLFVLSVMILSGIIYSQLGALKPLQSYYANQEFRENLSKQESMQNLTDYLIAARYNYKSYPAVLMGIADIQIHLKQYTDAMETADTGLLQNPTDVELRYQKLYAQFLQEGGAFIKEESFVALAQLINDAPQYFPALNLKAMVAFQQGDFKEAITIWEDLQKHNPEPNIQQSLNEALKHAKELYNEQIQTQSDR